MNVGEYQVEYVLSQLFYSASLKATLEQHVDTNFQSLFSLITQMMIILERKVTTTQLVQTIKSKPHKALLSLLYQVMMSDLTV